MKMSLFRDVARSYAPDLFDTFYKYIYLYSRCDCDAFSYFFANKSFISPNDGYRIPMLMPAGSSTSMPKRPMTTPECMPYVPVTSNANPMQHK
jgi:hypothetical protein